MDIAGLFKWSTVYFIKNEKGKIIKDESDNPIKVYIRIIGDNDLDECNKYSLKVSREMREQYKDNIKELIPDFKELSKDELIGLIVLNEADIIYKQANRDVEISYPKEPKDLTLSESERYEQEKNEYFDKLQEAVLNKVNELIVAQKEYYKKYNKTELMSIAKKTYFEKILKNEMTKAYNDAILYYAIYNDDKFEEKTFESIEQIRNASTLLKNQLNVAYQQLHLKDIELKK